MKNTIILMAMLLTTTATINAQSVGEKVQIESAGSWYDGKVKNVDADN